MISGFFFPLSSSSRSFCFGPFSVFLYVCHTPVIFWANSLLPFRFLLFSCFLFLAISPSLLFVDGLCLDHVGILLICIRFFHIRCFGCIGVGILNSLLFPVFPRTPPRPFFLPSLAFSSCRRRPSSRRPSCFFAFSFLLFFLLFSFFAFSSRCRFFLRTLFFAPLLILPQSAHLLVQFLFFSPTLRFSVFACAFFRFLGSASSFISRRSVFLVVPLVAPISGFASFG